MQSSTQHESIETLCTKWHLLEASIVAPLLEVMANTVAWLDQQSMACLENLALGEKSVQDIQVVVAKPH